MRPAPLKNMILSVFIGWLGLTTAGREALASRPVGPNSPAAEELSILGFGNLGKVNAPKAISQKAILDQAELNERYQKLSDKTLLAAAARFLTTVPAKLDEKTTKKRFEAIQFLAAATAWEENPAREKVIATIETAVKFQNLAGLKTMKDRKWIAGDKMELFEILVEYAPERAAQLENKSEGTWLAPILRYARTRYADLIRKDGESRQVWQ